MKTRADRDVVRGGPPWPAALMGCVLGAGLLWLVVGRTAEADPRPPIGGGVRSATRPLAPIMERPALGLAVRVRVVEVVDGDTIEVETVHRARVRLIDCWADETRTTDADAKARGLAAKDRLAAIATGKTGTLFVPTGGAARVGDVTSMGRVLGHVWLDGDRFTLSARQVDAGVAATRKGGRLGE